MRSSQPLVAPLSKTRLALLAFSAAGFVFMGVVLWLVGDTQAQRGPFIMKAAGVLSIVVFAPCCAYAARKLFDPTPGLIVDDQGIVDNASAAAAGRIPWSEIVDVRTVAVGRQRFLTFFVQDPQKYVMRGNFLKRRLNALHLQHFGSPIHISTSALAIRFDDLVKAIARGYQAHNSSPGAAAAQA